MCGSLGSEGARIDDTLAVSVLVFTSGSVQKGYRRVSVQLCSPGNCYGSTESAFEMAGI
jgi:hypothetical protein